MAKGKGSTSSGKKKATARGRANEKSASGGGPTRASVKKMSQDRFPGERPLTGEDRPSTRRGGKARGLSAEPRGRKAAGIRGGAVKRTPDASRARPSPRGHHM